MMEGTATTGRIDILSPMPLFDIPSYMRAGVDNKAYAKEANGGALTVNDLATLYFSEMNINALQDAIRYRVYVETSGKYTIGRQSDQELKVVMRSIYFQYGKNIPSDCVGQVRELNAKVLDWVIPEILSNILQYSVYRRDASTLPMPLDRSPNMSSKGTFAMELKQFM